MCIFDGGGDPKTTSGPDALTQRIRQAILPYAFQIANQSYPSYDPNARVQPFSNDQRLAMAKVRSNAKNPTPGYYDFASTMAKQYAVAPAGKVNTSRLVDENGRLGAIDDYMNPYVDRVVDPQIRQIGEAAKRNRIASGNAATMAGGFGDARHGVADSLTNREEMLATADVTGRGYSDAFNTAMGQRQGDLDRFLATDTMNQNLREQQLGRKMAGGQAAMDMGLANSQDYMARLNALMNSGKAQQQQGQHLRDARYQNFQQGVEWPFRQYDALLSMLTGQPSTQVTTQQGGGGSDIWGMLGPLLGAFL